jgi:rhomboid protease GluP
MFLHAGLLHIGLNAYILWIFGTAVEQEFGKLRLLLIYFATGIVASASSFAFGPYFAVGVGASGAIFGICGAFVAYNYRRRHLAIAAARLRSITTFVILNMVIAFAIPAIDWRAHVGGLVAGLFAGFAAEGVGTPSARRTILVVGFAGLLAVAFGLVAWRTSVLHSQFVF